MTDGIATVRFGVVTFNMGGGDSKYKHGFHGHLESFFNDYLAPRNLDAKNTPVLCLQEFKFQDGKHLFPAFQQITARGYQTPFWVVRNRNS